MRFGKISIKNIYNQKIGKAIKLKGFGIEKIQGHIQDNKRNRFNGSGL
jgi:hypothetical protein